MRAKNRAWLILLLSVLAGLLGVVFPVGLLLVPALWAYAGVRTKPVWIALPAAVYTALAYSVYGTYAALGLALAVAAAAVAIYEMQTRRVSNTYTALTLSGLFLAGLYTAVCLPGILDGSGAFAAAQNAIDSMLSLYREAASQTAGAAAESLELVDAYIEAFSDAVPAYVVAVLCLCSGVLGLSNLLFFRLFCHKNSAISISPMRAFRLWTLPRSMVLGLFALLVGAYVLQWLGWTFADSMVATVNVLVGMPLFLQGLCVVDFLIARSPKSATTARAVTYSVIALLLWLVQMPLILLGCLDQIFRFRERIQQNPPQRRPF